MNVDEITSLAADGRLTIQSPKTMMQGYAAIALLDLSEVEAAQARGDVCRAHMRFGRAATMKQLKQRAAEEEETREMEAFVEEQKKQETERKFLESTLYFDFT